MKITLMILSLLGPTAVVSAAPTATETKEIAKEAYIYGSPMVDNYRIMHAYFIDAKNPEYKAPFNVIKNIPRVYTPADTAVQTPNSDTPYSMIGMDLRAEPIVLTVPKIEKNRYFSIQLIDLYTFNFAYIGSRTTGNNGGKYMIAGPSWKGSTPKGIDKVIKSETELGMAAYRTQLFNPADLPNVVKIQSGYKVETLSKFLGQPAPKAAPQIDFIAPLTPATQLTSLDTFNILNFVLKFCPTDPSEVALMQRFAKIGVGANQNFKATINTSTLEKAAAAGMADGLAALNSAKKLVDEGKLTAGEMFGTRKFLKNNYLYRMLAANLGIYGNSKEEAMYPVLATDTNGQKLIGKNKYTLTFAKGQLPPVHAFWSLTMYDLPQSLLVANPINRYLINSPMLPNLKPNKDGSYTLYIQNESPGKDKESNWLPSPKGPFITFLRLYWPAKAALDGQWKNPLPVLTTSASVN